MAKSKTIKRPDPITLTLVAIKDDYVTVIANVYEWINEDGWLYVRTTPGLNFDQAHNMALLKEIEFSA